MKSVSYLSDDALYSAVGHVIDVIQKAQQNPEKKMNKNVLDPFSAIFESVYFDFDLHQWFEREISRQVQKTMQNSIGEFHQAVLGSVDGWENLGTGHVVDIINNDRRIAAEIKNKFNTTKGNHKKTVYDDLEMFLQKHPDYIVYYVEIIPQGAARYDKPFTPSDNTTKQRRPENERIRVIDGFSFYDLATQQPNALVELYKALPGVIAHATHKSPQSALYDKEFQLLFKRAFGVDI